MATNVSFLANTQTAHHNMSEALRKVGSAHDALLSIETKLAKKEDLKMADLLMYYSADGQAAKDLMLRRIKAYNKMKAAELARSKAQVSGKKVHETADAEAVAKETYESLTKTSKEE